MESGIEHGNLGDIRAEDLLADVDSGQIVGVVQRAEDLAFVNRFLDGGVHEDGTGEFLAAVKDAVADRADLFHIGDASVLRVHEIAGDEFHGLRVVRHLDVHFERFFPLGFDFEIASLDSDPIAHSLCEQMTAGHFHQLIFD